MRVVFLGTPDFAVPTLEMLLETRPGLKEVRVVGVITQPDRLAGRGRHLTAPPVKRIAQEAGLPVFQPQRLRGDPEALRFLQDLSPGLLVVVAFGQILPPEVFDFPPYGTLNVHASLLPRYRGAAPVARAILDGAEETGVTIMKIDAGMDTGDILTQKEVPVDENVTGGDLEEILSREGAELLAQTLPGYLAGEIQPRPQDHDRATRAPRLAREEGRIDWSRPSSEIHNRIRGLNPWPGAFSHLRNRVVKIWKSEKVPLTNHPGIPGQVLAVDPENLIVQCGRQTQIALKELQLAGRKRVTGRALASGLHLRTGESFH